MPNVTLSYDTAAVTATESQNKTAANNKTKLQCALHVWSRIKPFQWAR